MHYRTIVRSRFLRQMTPDLRRTAFRASPDVASKTRRIQSTPRSGRTEELRYSIFRPGRPRPHELTGKVEGVVYDHFGDFVGFILELRDGELRRFESREREIEDLVREGWTGGG
jgi:hypothetical protein